MNRVRIITLLFFGFFPASSFAAAEPATIITRTGVVTAPIKYHFDLSTALSEGVNQGVKATISASNAEKTAVRFESVHLFGKDGAIMGNNVASKTDALTIAPYGFSFQNFGITPNDLARVAGIQLTFMDLGGENPTGKVTVHNVAISITRDTGKACIIVDPITIITPPVPPPTVTQIQAMRPLVRPGTLGDGGSSGSGGSSSIGPNYGSSATNSGTAAIGWSAETNVFADDTNAVQAITGSPGQTTNLDVTGFGFSSIPTSATINGIIVEIDRNVAPGASAQDTTVYLISGGSTIGNNVASGASWPNDFTIATYGSATNASAFWGGAVNAPAIVLSTFGVRISVLISSPTTANIDHIRVTIHYTTVGASVYDSLIDLLRAFKKTIACRITPTSSCGK